LTGVDAGYRYRQPAQVAPATVAAATGEMDRLRWPLPTAFRRAMFAASKIIGSPGCRMSLSSYTKDGILTIVFDDARILDETTLEQLSVDLMEMLNKTTEERVILDFRNVKFMSSSFLGKLVQVHKKSMEFKVKLKLCSINSEIRQVFKITRLDRLFEIESDEASARAAFKKRGWFG
jgi:anti-anti-sigma factor